MASPPVEDTVMTLPPPTTTAQARPQMFLIVNNVQKTKNIKNMLVSASSFGVCEVFLVGQKKFDLQGDLAPFVAQLRCPVTRLTSLAECKARCMARGIRVVGVEIMENAKSILDEPFVGDTAFMMGNEVRALNAHVWKRDECGASRDLRRFRDHPPVRRRHRVAERDGGGVDHHEQLRRVGADPDRATSEWRSSASIHVRAHRTHILTVQLIVLSLTHRAQCCCVSAPVNCLTGCLSARGSDATPRMTRIPCTRPVVSSCTHHIVREARLLLNPVACDLTFQDANGNTMRATKRGCVLLKTDVFGTEKLLVLEEVYYLPSVPNNMFSIGYALHSKELTIALDEDACVLKHHGELVAVCKTTDNAPWVLHAVAVA
ncbi:Family trna rrna methyltransferase-like, partial [Globisporangium splendens]